MIHFDIDPRDLYDTEDVPSRSTSQAMEDAIEYAYGEIWHSDGTVQYSALNIRVAENYGEELTPEQIAQVVITAIQYYAEDNS